MCDFLAQSSPVIFVEFLDFFKEGWGLGNERAFDEERFDVGQIVSLRKGGDIGEELGFCEVDQRVADSGYG